MLSSNYLQEILRAKLWATKLSKWELQAYIMFSMHNAKNKDIHSKIKCELKTFNSLNQFCIQYLFIEGNINIDNKLTDNETKLEILDSIFWIYYSEDS